MVVADGRNHTAGPKSRSIATHMPTFILSAAFGGGSCQFLLRNIVRAILSGKKLPGMFSDYFPFGIAKYVTGTAIPVCYQPISICHKNRIIANVFYRLPIDLSLIHI